jgi:hypothetical protein
MFGAGIVGKYFGFAYSSQNACLKLAYFLAVIQVYTGTYRYIDKA